MTDKTDIAALREAAIKATPGNWKLGIGSTYAYVQASVDMKLGGKSFVKLCHVGRAGWRNQQSTIDDARYIALANPVAILAILDQLDVINKSEWNLAGDLVDAHNLLGAERQQRAAAEKERDDLKAINQHLDLAIRKAEVVNAKLLEKLANPVVLPAGYAARAGHPFHEGERNVMIPNKNGDWLSRFEVEHAIHVAGFPFTVKGE